MLPALPSQTRAVVKKHLVKRAVANGPPSRIEAAQAFAKSAELKSAMQGAGVVGAPTIWFTNKV
jgi:hypothetical protein